jgi:hypothetical protein
MDEFPNGADVMTGDVLSPVVRMSPDDVLGDVASAVLVASASVPAAVGFRADSKVESVAVASTDAPAASTEALSVGTIPPGTGAPAAEVPTVETGSVDTTVAATLPVRSFEGVNKEAVVLTWSVVITPASVGTAVKLSLAPESVVPASAGMASMVVLTALLVETSARFLVCTATPVLRVRPDIVDVAVAVTCGSGGATLLMVGRSQEDAGTPLS